MSDSTAFTIRDARSSDAEAIAAMARQLAVITYGAPGPLTAEKARDELIGAPGLGLLVAEIAGSAVGYALWTAAYETAHGARGRYLTDLFVEPACRRHGIARALVAELSRRARAEGGAYVWWMVHGHNTAAQAFYDRLEAVDEELHARAVFETPFETLADEAARGHG